MIISPHVAALIDLALAEDLGTGDMTCEALFPRASTSRAAFFAREPLVCCGLGVAEAVFQRLDRRCRFRLFVSEGTSVGRNQRIAEVVGPLPTLLAGERTALNFLRHLSGVSTLTRRYVRALSKTKCALLDTRKTTPGLRALEKAAVRHGGGTNHRMGLFDGILIKDNHISALGSIPKAVALARRRAGPMVRIEVETVSLQQVRQALRAGADLIMLDNMTPSQVRKAVAEVARKAQTEASGRLNLQSVMEMAQAGVDFVSVGALTHSAPAMDISMELAKS